MNSWRTYARRRRSVAADVNHQSLKGPSRRVAELNYREREILRLRYGLVDGYSYTLEEVGRIFSVTRERVRQIEAKAVRKLQQPARRPRVGGLLDRHDLSGHFTFGRAMRSKSGMVKDNRGPGQKPTAASAERRAADRLGRRRRRGLNNRRPAAGSVISNRESVEPAR